MPSPKPVVLAALLLAGCQAAPLPAPVDHVPGVRSERLAPGTSMLGEACDGHDPEMGLRVKGQSLVYVDVDIRLIANGTETPYAHGAAPGDYSGSQVASPRRGGVPSSSCPGVALRTHVFAGDHGFTLDYDVELAPATGGPAPAWRVQGRFPLALDGSGSKRFGFRAGGRAFAAYITSIPGPLWLADPVTRDVRGIVDEPVKSWGSPLPDEIPGRTLQESTNPAFRDSTFPAQP